MLCCVFPSSLTTPSIKKLLFLLFSFLHACFSVPSLNIMHPTGIKRFFYPLFILFLYFLIFCIFYFPALITKSDSGQDSSSPSTTPHTRGFSPPSTLPQTCAAPPPPAHPLSQPQLPPRVPPTPTSHAPHLGSPYPLSTPDVLAQGMTSVPLPAPTHQGLHPAPMLQSSPALIKVRR